MKVKLFTHTDFDGIGCAILAYINFGKDNVDVEYCNNPKNATEKVREFWSSEDVGDYDYIYITDISIDYDLANEIETDIFTTNGEVIKQVKRQTIKLFDHHPTALSLNKLNWCHITPKSNKLECGTTLFYEELYYNNNNNNILSEFIETVRQYDTWEWKTVYNNEIPVNYNDLLYIIGRDKFIENILLKISNNNLDLTKTDKLLLDIEHTQKESYIKLKNEELLINDNIFDNYIIGIVFAERFISQLGNQLCELNPKIDFVIIISSNSKISYRTIKDNVNLSEIAKSMGGGGHPKAAGSEIDSDIQDKIIKLIFKR